MSVGDVALGLAKGLATLSHPVGGAILAAIGDFIPSSKVRALERSVDCFRERVREWEDRIDESAVKKDEFTDLFLNAAAAIDRTTYQEKIEAAVNIIVNGCLRDGDPDKLPYDELDHFSRCVQSLSIGAFRLLKFTLNSSFQHRLDIESLCHHYGTEDRDLCIGLARELESCHLIDLSVADAMIQGQRSTRVYITDLGKRFHEHILSRSIGTKL